MSDKLYKYFTLEKSEYDPDKQEVTAIASKEVVDRDGDLIKVDGINLKQWKKNPVIMLFHNYNDFPIGMGIGKKAWVEGKDLKLKFKFLSEDNPKAEQASRLWQAGALKGLSIGFIPDYETMEYPDNKGTSKKKTPRRIFNNVELLEVSVVPIPANQEALMAGVAKEYKKELKELMEKPESETKSDGELLKEKVVQLEAENRTKDYLNDLLDDRHDKDANSQSTGSKYDRIYDLLKN